MVYQHETGVPIKVESAAAEELPFYRFVEINPENGFSLATGKHPLVGVTIPTLDAYKRIKDGTVQKRENKYFKDEIPRILRSGVCYVQVDGDIKIGDHITLGENGIGKKYNHPKELVEITSKEGEEAKGDSGSKSASGDNKEIFASFTQIKGMALDAKNRDNLVRVALSII